MERAKTFGATGILCGAVFIATLPNFPCTFPSPFEPKGCEFFGSLEVGVGVGNNLFFLGCRDLSNTRGVLAGTYLLGWEGGSGIALAPVARWFDEFFWSFWLLFWDFGQGG